MGLRPGQGKREIAVEPRDAQPVRNAASIHTVHLFTFRTQARG